MGTDLVKRSLANGVTLRQDRAAIGHPYGIAPAQIEEA
jgi:hypothetical protein